MDSIDCGVRASVYGEKREKKRVSDKPSKDKLILLYQYRAANNIDIFTGEKRGYVPPTDIDDDE
jgi:hypothetical protein